MKFSIQLFFSVCLFLVAPFLLQAQTSQVHVRTVNYDDAEEPSGKIDSFRTLQIMLAGNIYQPEELIKQAFIPAQKKYDFSNQLRYVNPILNIGDLVIANLKTGFTGDLASPFSAPDEFALSLKYTGINHFVMANLNTAYLDKRGMQRTKKQLEVFDIPTTGTFADNVTRNGNSPLIIYRKGFKIALLNYADFQKRPSISRDYLINQVDLNLMERDLRVTRSLQPDFIIVYMDWGGNFQEFPSYTQENLGKFLLEQGADLVVGTFPNTVQRVDIVPHYFQAKEREGLVAYSLGNVIASSQEERAKTGVILDLEIKKNNITGKTIIGDYGFIPIWNYFDTTSPKKKLYVLPVAAVEHQEVFKNMPSEDKIKMLKDAYTTRKMLGRTADEIQYNLTDLVVENVEASTQLTNAPLNNRFNPFAESKLAITAAPVAAKKQVEISQDSIYRIQFYEMEKVIPIDTNYYVHLKGYEILKEGNFYRYFLGNSAHFQEINKLFLEVMHPRYKQAIVVVYYDGKRIREISFSEMKDKNEIPR